MRKFSKGAIRSKAFHNMRTGRVPYGGAHSQAERLARHNAMMAALRKRPNKPKENHE